MFYMTVCDCAYFVLQALDTKWTYFGSLQSSSANSGDLYKLRHKLILKRMLLDVDEGEISPAMFFNAKSPDPNLLKDKVNPLEFVVEEHLRGKHTFVLNAKKGVIEALCYFLLVSLKSSKCAKKVLKMSPKSCFYTFAVCIIESYLNMMASNGPSPTEPLLKSLSDVRGGEQTEILLDPDHPDQISLRGSGKTSHLNKEDSEHLLKLLFKTPEHAAATEEADGGNSITKNLATSQKWDKFICDTNTLFQKRSDDGTSTAVGRKATDRDEDEREEVSSRSRSPTEMERRWIWKCSSLKQKPYFEKCRFIRRGECANYIPELSTKLWGLSICTPEGTRESFGDANTVFTLQSITKTSAYILACSQHEKPLKPLVNCGALVVAAILKVNGNSLEDAGSAEDKLEYYLKLCSIEGNCESISIMAGTLANGVQGVNPITKTRIFDKTICRNTLSLMCTAGNYDNSGAFFFHVGLPVKSGVSGGLLVVVPGKLGLCTFAPPLDSFGNSARSVHFCKELAKKFNCHILNGREDSKVVSFLLLLFFSM